MARRSTTAEYVPGAAVEPTPIAAVNHDGTIRWSRCFTSDMLEGLIVAAPEYRPANALMPVPFQPQAGQPPEYRWVQLSLATGAEQPTFAAAMQSAGIDAGVVARLIGADGNGRYALFVDTQPSATSITNYQHIVRYDLAADVASDIAVPAELQDPSLGVCGMTPQLSLSGWGDVIITSGTLDGGATVVALWHDGAWSRDPATLATVMGVHVTYACSDGSQGVPASLRGIDALGQVVWTDPDLTFAGEEGTWIYVDGAVTVTQVCSHHDSAGSCDAHQLVGIDQTTGKLRWTRPGLRLVAGDPAHGYALAQADDLLGASPPGWFMLDDRTGRSVSGQSWNDPMTFIHPCCGDENGTVRAGGIVLVTVGEQVRVWYPKGTGGEQRTAIIEPPTAG